MVNKELSVCILGKGNTKYLPKCIEYASKISREVLYIDLESDNQSKDRAAELGVRVVNLNSFASALNTEWVIFVRPSEAPILTSKKTLYSMLNNKEHNGYLVYTKSDTAKSLLEKYQLIRTLGQYKKIADLAYVTMIEPRLVRKAYATYCLENLITDSSQKQPDFCRKIVKGLSIKSIPEDKSTVQEEDEEHDKRCLNGEICYGPVVGEGLDELSSGYIGYRVVHEGYFDSFMDGARRGFGIDRMYVPMLEYLNKNGHVAKAKDLFELWISNRDGKESLDIQRIGGLIYANLFLLDEAIAWYEKAAEMYENPLAYANMGKLYLIKGDRGKAITYLKKSIDKQPDPFHEKILPIIDKEGWRPQTLTLCMIVKDEENTIRNTLESMKNIADEIVVVDTGSSDRTRDVVREYGGKVIEAEWHDDFSAARNLALQEAHSDYIFFLDADEFVDIRDRMGLALFKKMLPLDQDIAFTVRIEPDKESQGLSV
ncbi:glycosyltransferase, partial [bacterium]|nr:glycosyltransferase [bacterium]